MIKNSVMHTSNNEIVSDRAEEQICKIPFEFTLVDELEDFDVEIEWDITVGKLNTVENPHFISDGIKDLTVKVRMVEAIGNSIDEMRINAARNPLFNEGDMKLMWVNEGDMYLMRGE